MEQVAANTRRKWSGRDRFKLLRLCEEKTLEEVGKELGRSAGAIRNRLHLIGVKIHSSTLYLTEFCRRTGYDYKQVKKARDALGQTWRKLGNKKRSRFMITEEQANEICEFFKSDSFPVEPFGNRLWKFVDKRSDGHWIYSGAKVFTVAVGRGEYKSYRPSRLAWMLTKDVELSEKQKVVVKCHVDGCINPDHCELE